MQIQVFISISTPRTISYSATAQQYGHGKNEHFCIALLLKLKSRIYIQEAKLKLLFLVVLGSCGPPSLQIHQIPGVSEKWGCFFFCFLFLLFVLFRFVLNLSVGNPISNIFLNFCLPFCGHVCVSQKTSFTEHLFLCYVLKLFEILT